jgi:hypothetical protein
MRRCPIFTCIAFATLVVALIIGLGSVASYQRSSSDWGLLSGFTGLFTSLFTASWIILLISIVARIRKESHSAILLLITIPSFCFFSFISIGEISYKLKINQERSDKQEWTEHKKRLISDGRLIVSEEWPNDNSPRGKALRGLLWKGEGDFLSKDILTLSKKQPSWKDTIYYHPNCPLSLLKDGFTNYKKDSIHYQISASFREILANPNSPIEFVEEVLTWSDLSEPDLRTLQRIHQNKLNQMPNKIE